MKVSKETTSTVSFGDINVAQCFSHSGKAYIKISAIQNGMNSLDIINAYRLEDAFPGHFQHTTRVTLHRDAEVVLG